MIRIIVSTEHNGKPAMSNTASVRTLSANERFDPSSIATVPWFDHLRRIDVGQLGGKNASLGMTCSLAHAGIYVPPGFPMTSADYLFRRSFVTSWMPITPAAKPLRKPEPQFGSRLWLRNGLSRLPSRSIGR
jgi:hypothetical protein